MATSDLIVDKFRYRGAQPGDVLTGIDADGYMIPLPPGGAGVTGSYEPEIVFNPVSGLPELEFAINADGEWDLIMVWRAA